MSNLLHPRVCPRLNPSPHLAAGRTVGPALLLLSVLLQGCQYDPHAHLYTTVKPRAADVAGHYKLTEQTVTSQGLSVLRGRPCFVELRTDGTFTAANIPPDTMGPPGTNFFNTLVSGSGRWRIGITGGVDAGWGKAKMVWGVYFDDSRDGRQPRHREWGKYHAANLAGAKPPYVLIFGLDDPDSGLAMILTRDKQ